MPDLRLDFLDQIGAEAIAAARAVDTAIGIDVLPNLARPERRRPKDIRARLVPDRLFEAKTLADLEGLVAAVEEAILEGTTEEEIHDASPENVSVGSWTTRLRDRQCEALCLALPVLHDLRDRLQSIQDLLVARRVFGQMIADM